MPYVIIIGNLSLVMLTGHFQMNTGSTEWKATINNNLIIYTSIGSVIDNIENKWPRFL